MKSRRISILTLALMTASPLSLVAAATPALAQETSYDIAAQPLASAILEYSRQSNVAVLAPMDLVKGKRAPAVRGSFSASDALDRLLAGSGLRAVRGANGGLSLVRASAAGNGSGAASSGAAQGQAVLVGSVRDHKTGAALKGARVQVIETGDMSSTGDLGDFRFARLPTGDVTLQISYLGFPDQTETVSVLGGLTNRTDIYLGSGATSEIVVIGQVSARAQALNQERTNENSTTVISGDLLGNFNGTTISDSLRRAPGVSFQQNDQTGDGTNIIVRGLSPDYNQIKLNGLALPEGSGTGRSANLSNILSDSISEIKISKTLLASQDSSGTGGLVEIETKSPLDRPRRYFNISADTTQRAKRFGRDYMLSGTASLRFGAADNFGLSASVQYRKQNLTTYSYRAQGVPGAYLPLAPNGQPATEEDLDPRSPFPFYEGAEWYTVAGSATRNSARSTTSNVSLAAEWQVDDTTNLRLDYVRSRRTSDTLNVSFDIASYLGGYFNVQPVPAEGGEPRTVYSDLLGAVNASTAINYTGGVKADTDALSFRGETALGALSLKYRAGWSRGSSASPYSAFLNFGALLPADAVNLAPEAIDPATGTVVTYFGPRRGRNIPIPLLSQAGFDALRNSPLPTFNGMYVFRDQGGRSTNWTGGLDAKYDVANSLLQYVETGLEIRRSNFRSRDNGTDFYDPVLDPVTSEGAALPDLGFAFENFPFGRVTGGDTAYRLVTRDSILGFLNDPGILTEGGYATLIPATIDPLLADQYTREEDIAGYLQARIDIGRLEIIGGVRINRSRVAAAFTNAVQIYDENFVLDQPYFDQTRMIIEASDSLTSYLPRLLVNFRPSKNLVFRAGYYSTVARPQVRLLNSQRSITYYGAPFFGPTGSQPALFITEGNPGLKPARTHNFDIGGEWYDGSVGVIKLNLFVKRISNLLESNIVSGFDNLGDYELPDHPVFQNLPANTYVEYSLPVNNPDTATVWGIEAAVERRLSFLPGVLSGLGVYANYTYSRSKKTQLFNWSTSPVYDGSGTLIGRENISYSRTIAFDQSPRHSGTVGLTYSRPGIDASLYYTAQARRQNGASRYNLDLYDEAVSSLDFRGVYSFSLAGADLRLSVEALNLLKSRSDANTESSIGGVGGSPKYYTGGYFLGGRSFAVGLSATF